jgi:hypothetical protein
LSASKSVQSIATTISRREPTTSPSLILPTAAWGIPNSGFFESRENEGIPEDKRFKLGLFARFCAFELLGTNKPNERPPVNSRVAKALRFLGFEVRAST